MFQRNLSWDLSRWTAVACSMGWTQDSYFAVWLHCNRYSAWGNGVMV